MADRPLSDPLPADLPEDWTSGQIIAPAGADVGLSEQHGYNYLMAAVNAAQRAANAINESFDNISGKRACRITVGTSTAGWTQADCDFLCDGTDDQLEIQAAIDAAPSIGCEIVLLDGTYHLNGAINANRYSLWIHGNGESTVLVRETEDGIGSIKYLIVLYPGSMLSDLSYNGNGKAEEGGFEIVLTGSTVKNVEFYNCGYGCLYAQSYGAAGSQNRVDGCACIGANGGTFVFVRMVPSVAHLVIERNNLVNTTYLMDCISGISSRQPDFVCITENTAGLEPGAVAIDTYNSSGFSVFLISNNFLSKIEVSDEGGYASHPGRGAVIYGNVFSGNDDGDPAITLGPNTKNNSVFGNMLHNANGNLVILDQGEGNVIFGNSDDSGSGGGGTAGVSSFKGRSGAVVPQNGDYTAAMVGAIPTGAVTAIQAVTQAEYDALATKNATTLYLIKE